MIAACHISETINNFDKGSTKIISDLLNKYELPIAFTSDKQKTWEILLHDKKKSGINMSFVVLDSIGKASIKSIPLHQLYKIFNSI